MENNQHYASDQLIDYLEGHLNVASRAELFLHLESGCPECNSNIAFYQRMFSAMQTLQWKRPSHNAHRKVIQAYSAKFPTKTKIGWRPLLRPAFIGFTVLVLITFAFLFNLNPGVVYAGYIENVTGQVEMFNSNTGVWDAVAEGQSVPIKASIRAMADAQATITFPGGEQTILGSESEVRLIKLTQSKGSWDISLEQTSGQTENQTSQNTHSFTVRTSAVIANSSSGIFVLNVNSDGSVVASVLEGEVETRSDSQNSVMHSGETSVFPSNKPTELSTDSNDNQIEPSPNASPELSLTSTPSIEPTEKPKDIGKPTRTPTPTIVLPLQSSTTNGVVPTNSSSNSTNADVDCSPGNSNGAGNSENASNSDTACKK